ncbi:hypothetical protein NXX23_17745 [Bacteroides ovatus]|nr:hypothetical protein [Bacteroides ovatus]
METALQRIIRKTGRRTGRVPLPSVQAAMPDTVPRYAGRHPPVAESRIQGASCTHSVGGKYLLLGKIPYIVPMVQAKQEAGGCTFFQDGLCELHAAGLKPTEGRLSHHTITMENLKFGMSLSWNVLKNGWTSGTSTRYGRLSG